MKLTGKKIAIILILSLIAFYVGSMFYKYKIMPEAPLLEMYGSGYVIITGGSSGQGKRFALELADRGFDICLIGSKRSYRVQDDIMSMGRRCVVIERDFRKPWDDEFESVVRDFVYSHRVCGLINNVGHRVGWFPYHAMPHQLINDTILCGTMPQVHLTRVILPKLLERPRSFLIFITAQCVHPGGGSLTVPGLAAYEATNAFGFHHAENIIREYEYRSNLDILNVTPGAVLTSNTQQSLSQTTFAVSDTQFVQTILRFLGGNVPNGPVCGDWRQDMSVSLFAPLFPNIVDYSTGQAGESITKEFMDKYKKGRLRSYS